MVSEKFIVDVWTQMGGDVVGAAELEVIQQALLEKGLSASPASIARILADEGARLVHPEILNADVHWRSAKLISPEELNFDTPASAVTWMDRLARRVDHEQLRQSVLNLKRELDLVIASERTPDKDRQLATEVHQWLTIWLQNPGIFGDWFSLRRNTAEFHQIFGP